MPIIHMAMSQSEIPAHAANVRDVSSQYGMSLWLYDTHTGLCLEDKERNGRDDSDWDMLVWNLEKQEPEWVMGFASTRGWSYPCYGSTPDATPEVAAAYASWCKTRDERAARLHQERLQRMPCNGKILKVVKGRKVPVGTTGLCFWSNTRFETDRVIGILFKGYTGRVGIDTPEGRVFTDVKNVEVVA